MAIIAAYARNSRQYFRDRRLHLPVFSQCVSMVSKETRVNHPSVDSARDGERCNLTLAGASLLGLSLDIEAPGSHVPRESLYQSRAAELPVTVQPITRLLLDLS
jgi:hypothetical protein